MNQRELNRSIAAATGEPVCRIARLGFLLADPSDVIDDPNAEELGPHVLDFDVDLDQEHSFEPEPKTALELLFA